MLGCAIFAASSVETRPPESPPLERDPKEREQVCRDPRHIDKAGIPRPRDPRTRHDDADGHRRVGGDPRHEQEEASAHLDRTDKPAQPDGISPAFESRRPEASGIELDPSHAHVHVAEVRPETPRREEAHLLEISHRCWRQRWQMLAA